MNHEFIARNDEENKCIECGYPKDKHGDNAVCDCCDKTGNLIIFGNGKQQMLLTRECMEREKALLETEIAINTTLEEHGISPFGVPSNGEDRVIQNHAIIGPYQKLINESKKLDEKLHLSSDIFTAKTVTINELREAIWKDDSIPSDGKFFELVKICKERVSHFQNVIFDLDKAKIEAYSEQKAWHIYMNQYANQLRAEEREKLRISDITYDIKVPKRVTPKAIKLSKQNASEADVRKAALELTKELGATEGIQPATLRMLMVSKNLSLEEAIKRLRIMLKTDLSE